MIRDYLKEIDINSIKTLERIPDIDNRAFWDGLDSDLKEELIKEGLRVQSEPWSVILLSDYREFYETGNRVHYEDKCFSRRIKLSALVMAECAENEGRFIKDILDGIYMILEESSWCHPAHNSHIRDAKQTNMPDITAPVIDLFAAETGAVIGVAEFVLRPRLWEINDKITDHIEYEIRNRLLIPYLNEHFWWMGDEENKAINWTVWITQNILLSFFTRSEGFIKETDKEKIINQAALSTDYFVMSYGEDGCCDEGAQYYTHAGLCLFGILELLNDLGKGAFSEAFRENKIKNIGSYIRKIYVGNGYYVNYADCAARAGLRSAREFLFGKRCDDKELCAFAADDYKEESWGDRLLTSEHNLWYRILQAGYHKEMMGYPDRFHGTYEDVFFESTGLFVARNNKFLMAAKAGHNDDSHNHNDVGSVTVYKNNMPYLIDLGVETYSAKTFSERRYEIWTMRSLFHNIPSFVDGDNEIEELPGREYRADAVNALDNEHKISMDISRAFGNSGIKSYIRTVRLDENGIILEDEYEGSLDAVFNLMTYEEPKLLDDNQIKLAVGDLGEITFDIEPELKESKEDCHQLKTDKIQIERIDISDARLSSSWKHEVYRIRIPFRAGKITAKLS